MKTDRYLGELGTELRLRLPDERTAEIVAEIAGHLDASGNDPISELGDPTELAHELLASEQSSRIRMVRIAVLASVCVFAGLLGLKLVSGGSPLQITELIPQVVMGLVFGGISLSYGSRIRSAVRTRSRRTFAIYVAGMTALIMVGVFVQEQIRDVPVEVPNARWLGVALLIGGFGGSFLVIRPLKFAAESGLRTNKLGMLKLPTVEPVPPGKSSR